MDAGLVGENAGRIAGDCPKEVGRPDTGAAVEDGKPRVLAEPKRVVGGLLNVLAPLDDRLRALLGVLGLLGRIEGEFALSEGGFSGAECRGGGVRSGEGWSQRLERVGTSQVPPLTAVV